MLTDGRTSARPCPARAATDVPLTKQARGAALLLGGGLLALGIPGPEQGALQRAARLSVLRHEGRGWTRSECRWGWTAAQAVRGLPTLHARVRAQQAMRSMLRLLKLLWLRSGQRGACDALERPLASPYLLHKVQDLAVVLGALLAVTRPHTKLLQQQRLAGSLANTVGWGQVGSRGEMSAHSNEV